MMGWPWARLQVNLQRWAEDADFLLCTFIEVLGRLPPPVAEHRHPVTDAWQKS
jgi:hypothetical protein